MTALAGCGDPTGPLSQGTFVGTYAMSSFNGRALPSPIPGTVLAFFSRTIELRADSTYRTVEITGGLTSARQDTIVGRGTWAFRPGSLRGRDAVWLTGSGALWNLSFPYKIRDRGRTLYEDETLDGGPRPVSVYTKR